MPYRKPIFTVRLSLELIKKFEDKEAYEYAVKEDSVYSLSLTCPHCDTYSVFNIVGEFVTEVEDSLFEYHFTCLCPYPGCQKVIFVTTNRHYYPTLTNHELIDAIWSQGKILNIYPTKEREIEVSEFIPEVLKDDYYMANKLLDISPKLAAITARFGVERLIKHLYPNLKGSLESIIPQFIELEKTKNIKGFEAFETEFKLLKYVTIETYRVFYNNNERIEISEYFGDDFYHRSAADFNLAFFQKLLDHYFIHKSEFMKKYAERKNILFKESL